MKPPNKQTMGQRIRDLREKHGLTQAQLATAAGVSPRVVSKLEVEDGQVMLATAAAIAAALGVGLDYLAGTAQPKAP